MATENPIYKSGDIHSVQSFAAREPAFTEASIRWTIFRHKLELIELGAIFFVGKKLLIDRDRYIEVLKAGRLAK